MPIPTGKQDVYGLVDRWYTRLTALDIGATETSAVLAEHAAPVAPPARAATVKVYKVPLVSAETRVVETGPTSTFCPPGDAVIV